MAEFTIGAHTYSSGKMDAFAQFHVARRLAPVFSGLKDAYAMGAMPSQELLKAGDENAKTAVAELFMKGMDAAALAISGMTDADSEYVLKACLNVTRRRQGAAWSPLQVGGRMQFDDLDLPAMMQIAWQVLQENLSPFFSGLQGAVSSAAPQA